MTRKSRIGLTRSRSFLDRVKKHAKSKLFDMAHECETTRFVFSPERPLDTVPLPGLIMLWCLVHAGAPVVLGQLTLALLVAPGLNFTRELDYVEFFSGCASIVDAYLKAGLLAVPYERKEDAEFCDFCSNAGFAHALHLGSKLKWGAAAHAAIVCSTYVFINSGTSMRSQGRPLGRASCSVDEGNLMGSRIALLLLFLDAIGVAWTLEQPISSVLQFHPRIQQLLASVRTFRTRLQLWDFGAPTRKWIYIYSNCRWIGDLNRFKIDRQGDVATHSLVHRYVNKAGRPKIQGNAALKASQAYPPAFGEAMRKCMQLHSASMADHGAMLRQRAHHAAVTGDSAKLLELLGTNFCKKGWLDAKLAGVFNYLAQSVEPGQGCMGAAP